jgi:TonB family protein
MPASPAPVREEPKSAGRASASRGEVVHQVLPEVSPSAQRTISGTIKIAVRVEVGTSGKVTATKLTTAGPSRYFANLTLKAAQQWDFSPPTINGQPTTSTWLLRFRLRRDSIKASAEQMRR